MSFSGGLGPAGGQARNSVELVEKSENTTAKLSICALGMACSGRDVSLHWLSRDAAATLRSATVIFGKFVSCSVCAERVTHYKIALLFSATGEGPSQSQNQVTTYDIPGKRFQKTRVWNFKKIWSGVNEEMTLTM